MIGMVLTALAAGCSTDKVHERMREDPVPLTDFLPENERLVRRADTFLVHYTWLDTNAVAAAEFRNVYLAPDKPVWLVGLSFERDTRRFVEGKVLQVK